MSSGYTNKGKYRELESRYRDVAVPTNYHAALVKTSAPGPDTNTLGDLTEIATGNGYTSGGKSLTPGATDFDTLTEDDASDVAFVQLKDITWTASGGPLPSDGNGAEYMVLTDDNATVANREVFAYWDLGGARVVSDTQDLTIQDAELRLTE